MNELPQATVIEGLRRIIRFLEKPKYFDVRSTFDADGTMSTIEGKAAVAENAVCLKASIEGVTKNVEAFDVDLRTQILEEVFIVKEKVGGLMRKGWTKEFDDKDVAFICSHFLLKCDASIPKLERLLARVQLVVAQKKLSGVSPTIADQHSPASVSESNGPTSDGCFQWDDRKTTQKMRPKAYALTAALWSMSERTGEWSDVSDLVTENMVGSEARTGWVSAVRRYFRSNCIPLNIKEFSLGGKPAVQIVPHEWSNLPDSQKAKPERESGTKAEKK